jgi:AhpD family alkylhydroperoxidase
MAEQNEERALNEKEQEIIAVGASVASGCLPCTKFHVRAASRTGASEEEVLQAVRDATRVRMEATGIMARAGGLPAEAGQTIRDSVGAGSLIRELVSISAAYAINCSTSLEAHVAAARGLGASDRHVFAAIKIACQIKDVASGKVQTVAGVLLGASEEEAAECGCAEDKGTVEGGASSCAPSQPGEAESKACSCQSEDHGRSGKSKSNPKEN